MEGQVYRAGSGARVTVAEQLARAPHPKHLRLRARHRLSTSLTSCCVAQTLSLVAQVAKVVAVAARLAVVRRVGRVAEGLPAEGLFGLPHASLSVVVPPQPV